MSKQTQQTPRTKERLPSSAMAIVLGALLIGAATPGFAIPELAPATKAEKPKTSEQRSIPGEKQLRMKTQTMTSGSKTGLAVARTSGSFREQEKCLKVEQAGWTVILIQASSPSMRLTPG